MAPHSPWTAIAAADFLRQHLVLILHLSTLFSGSASLVRSDSTTPCSLDRLSASASGFSTRTHNRGPNVAICSLRRLQSIIRTLALRRRGSAPKHSPPSVMPTRSSLYLASWISLATQHAAEMKLAKHSRRRYKASMRLRWRNYGAWQLNYWERVAEPHRGFGSGHMICCSPVGQPWSSANNSGTRKGCRMLILPGRGCGLDE